MRQSLVVAENTLARRHGAPKYVPGIDTHFALRTRLTWKLKNQALVKTNAWLLLCSPLSGGSYRNAMAVLFGIAGYQRNGRTPRRLTSQYH